MSKVKANVKNTLLVVPVFNSAAHLSELFYRIFEQSEKCQVLCINDGSTDNSIDIIKQHSVRYIDYEKNYGKGYALKMGMVYAKRNGYNFVLTIDSDLQHDPAVMINFIKTQRKQDSDLVIGYRRFNMFNMPFMRFMSNYITSSIVSGVVKQGILDSQSGFRLYNLDFFHEDDVYSERYQMETEILLRYAKNDAKISYTEIPVIYSNEVSNINNTRDITNFVKVIWKELI